MNISDLFPLSTFTPTTKCKGEGIYIIYCIISNKVYVGSSTSIHKRWYDHRLLLKKKKHPNIHLQRTYDKYGRESLVFKVIELTTELHEREKFYLDELGKTHEILNLADPIRICPFKFSDEFRRKRSEIMRGNTISKGIKHTEETRRNNSEGHKKLWREMSKQDKDQLIKNRSPNLRKAICKITIEMAREIKHRLSIGERPFAIAKILNIKPYFVVNIKNGSSWKDI